VHVERGVSTSPSNSATVLLTLSLPGCSDVVGLSDHVIPPSADSMKSPLSQSRIATRLAAVEEHANAENRHDLDTLVATFGDERF
jgi:hypothetical protein